MEIKKNPNKLVFIIPIFIITYFSYVHIRIK